MIVIVLLIAVVFAIGFGLVLTKMAELLISLLLMFCSTYNGDYAVYG